MTKHYKGKLGEFDYDDKEFEIRERSGGDISNNSSFTMDTLEKAESGLKDKLNQTCANVIISLFSIKDDKKT